MDKKDAIRTIIQAAKIYDEQLEGKKFLIVHKITSATAYDYVEILFHSRNFMHLTGITENKDTVKSSIDFYKKCINNRLAESDFEFAEDGTTVLKLEILTNLLKLKTSAQMIGDFIGPKKKLYTQKVTGGVRGCLGLLNQEGPKTYIPNSALKEDIRNITPAPSSKVYAIFYKATIDDKYKNCSKLDKTIKFEECTFSDEIEALIEREHMEFDFKK